MAGRCSCTIADSHGDALEVGQTDTGLLRAEVHHHDAKSTGADTGMVAMLQVLRFYVLMIVAIAFVRWFR